MRFGRRRCIKGGMLVSESYQQSSIDRSYLDEIKPAWLQRHRLLYTMLLVKLQRGSPIGNCDIRKQQLNHIPTKTILNY